MPFTSSRRKVPQTGRTGAGQAQRPAGRTGITETIVDEKSAETVGMCERGWMRLRGIKWMEWTGMNNLPNAPSLKARHEMARAFATDHPTSIEWERRVNQAIMAKIKLGHIFYDRRAGTISLTKEGKANGNSNT